FVDQNPIAPGRHSVSARAALERRTAHVPDVQADPEYAYARRDMDLIRTMVAVPMLKGDDLVGAITAYKLEVKPFTDKQIALLQTFADQAVIAIENVRLFTELQEKNRALTAAHAQVTESLEQQTATSEILRVISSSPTELQPVFDVNAKNAFQLCGGAFAILYRYDGVLMSVVADVQLSSEGSRVLRALYPPPPPPDPLVALSTLHSPL